jgi:hypothetical protein
MIQLIATALTIAASTFGATACGAGKSPRLYVQPLPARELALAVSRDCSINYNSRHRFTPYELCAATVHEYGHLAGHWRHSSNPRSIMYSRLTYGWGPCVRAAGSSRIARLLRGIPSRR